MRHKIQKLGRARIVLLFTIISIAVIIVLDIFVAYVLSHDIRQSQVLSRAIIITAVLAPFILTYIFDLFLEIEELEKEKNNLETYDNLTGLLNKHVFYKSCEKSHHYAIRNKQAYCIMAVELDNFNGIIEKYGFAGGEKVLTVFGHVANGTVRDSDILARLDGEGFAFFLPNTNIDQAKILAERLIDQVRKKAVIHEGTKYIRYTASIGIFFNEHNKSITLDDGLKMAEEALRIAQEKEGSHLEVYTRKKQQTT